MRLCGYYVYQVCACWVCAPEEVIIHVGYFSCAHSHTHGLAGIKTGFSASPPVEQDTQQQQQLLLQNRISERSDFLRAGRSQIDKYFQHLRLVLIDLCIVICRRWGANGRRFGTSVALHLNRARIHHHWPSRTHSIYDCQYRYIYIHLIRFCSSAPCAEASSNTGYK